MIGGDHIIGQDAAVAPAAHAQAVRIGHAALDDVIDARLQILHFIVAPVGRDGPGILAAAAGAAAIIHGQHRVAVGGEPLCLCAEGVLILPVGTAVDAQQQRDLLPAT